MTLFISENELKNSAANTFTRKVGADVKSFKKRVARW